MKSRKTVYSVMFVFLVLLLVSTLAGGCAPAPAAPAPGEAQPPQQAPPAQEQFTLTVATTWPAAINMHTQMPVRWAEDVYAASGGRLRIEVHPAGALVPAPEVLDAASAGTIDAYHTFAGYWIGKMPASPFFSSVPMLMEPFMHLAWVYEGGGLELWQRMYDEAGYNVKIIPLGNQHPETLAYSNRPLRTLDDWQGLKYRTVGWWAEILRERGISVTTLPAAEIYPALERGVLDAAEFSSPPNDRVLAFYEVTRYVAGPGMHQPNNSYYIGINKDSWNALPADLQALVEVTARAVTLSSWVNDVQESMETFDYYREQGLEFVKVDEAVQRQLKADTVALLDKRAAELGGVFADIWNSVKEFRARFVQYEDMMVPVRVE